MTETTNMEGLGQDNADTPSSIAEIWQQWVEMTGTFHAASDSNSRAATHAYGAAKILALCLGSIQATCMDDIKPKVIVAAWLKHYGDASHADLMLEAAIAADHEALAPPFERELH
ncbi:hypothetical protein P7D22_17380 [Lichenihabitans sp. Uapishka_5]|uniref:hypothetical protein n=1 Tax=Lichenihabitans sp. Uapishka_5 TaxID=3037302 RepID=UPI0029E81B34|nr:hypothetical protein [Lichenihabitans sp. Uapishka_5]MDX7952939.1 hypothetical protein [Lichenihabitans sp. Uapishka_5]